MYPIVLWHTFHVYLSPSCCAFKYDCFLPQVHSCSCFRPPPPHHCSVVTESSASSACLRRVINHHYHQCLDSIGGGADALRSGNPPVESRRQRLSDKTHYLSWSAVINIFIHSSLLIELQVCCHNPLGFDQVQLDVKSFELLYHIPFLRVQCGFTFTLAYAQWCVEFYVLIPNHCLLDSC